MSTNKCASVSLSPVHPPLGTLIDGHSLELVDVLGVGGYGVVYRAVDVDPLSLTGHLKSYAVKCLIAPPNANPRQRHVHIREIALHQLASVHPGVVTLHRVIEHHNITYIILDYAPDHDLFTQILRNCRYLGNDDLIKHIFLQLLDAVEYCHMLGIYHRDLKPENVLCFDGGLRVAITDFGLATTEKMSDEFRTGSVYHMSPECQGGEFAPDGYYCPQANDVWSLGIVLLNLATGRNPWKSATASDPTFQAYLHDPVTFLPSVLPISRAANDLLLRMLDVNWRTRITLPEVRRAVKGMDSFYCDGVIFEGSMARCPWEAGMDLDTDEEEILNDVDEHTTDDWRKKPAVYSVDDSSSSSSSSSSSGEEFCDSTSKGSKAAPDSLTGLPPHSTKSALATAVTEASRWSVDSETSEIVFASRPPSISFGEDDVSSFGTPWTDFTSSKATWGCESSMAPSPIRQSTYGYPLDVNFHLEDGLEHASRDPYVHIARSGKVEFVFSASESPIEDIAAEKKPELTLNTHLDAFKVTPIQSFYLSPDAASMASISTQSSDTMQTAHEYDTSSVYFLADSSTFHSPKSPRDVFPIPISTSNSAYEDPLSVLLTEDPVPRPLTPPMDAEMASPSKGDSIWRADSVTRVSLSGVSSPSRYSVSSASIPPLPAKWSDSDLGEEVQKRRLSCINSSSTSGWSAVFGAASVKTGGIRSPYYSFRRSNAPSPEESAARVALLESTDAPDVGGSDVVDDKIIEDESQPTFSVDDGAKLTNKDDSCLLPLRPIAESSRDALPSDVQDLPGRRLEPQHSLEAQPQPSEQPQQENSAEVRARAKSRRRHSALSMAMRFLSRTGSPTPQKTPPCPSTTDSTSPKKRFGFSATVQEALPSSQQTSCPAPSADATSSSPGRERRSLSPTRGCSPVRSGTIPAPQSRNGRGSAVSRHPRRATVHIGSIFHRAGSESEHPSVFLSTLAAAAEALTASPVQSPPFTPEATVASSSTSTSPLSTLPRTASPEQLPSPKFSSPATASMSAPSPFIPEHDSPRSRPTRARSRRWTVNGWSKVGNFVIPDRRHTHDTSKDLPPEPVESESDPYPVHLVSENDQKPEVDRSNTGDKKECCVPKDSPRRRRGWLPSLLGRGSGNGFDLHKVVKMPIEAGKWLGSLSGGSSRSKSGNSVKNVGVLGNIW